IAKVGAAPGTGDPNLEVGVGGQIITTTTNADTVINANAQLGTDADLTMNINNGSLVNNGTVFVPASTLLKVQSTSNLTITGTGTIQAVLGGQPNVQVSISAVNS